MTPTPNPKPYSQYGTQTREEIRCLETVRAGADLDNRTVPVWVGHPGALLRVVHSEVFGGDDRAALPHAGHQPSELESEDVEEKVEVEGQPWVPD